ncbi:hypothetical protein FKV24_018715 [Lysobacter maris]|uniref:Uncharacterized protein n=1 Tax=Marilutibacter maris TaxID=1605891 RepID=A0A507ZPJ1_9GAMM|nr:hypothetical protein [Lysobacter maris]KAB8161870.1 hypothetical protein FKV24_018715 [Lysobacter maris]
MKPVEDRFVQTRFSNTFPRTVELLCPHCDRPAILEASSWQEHGQQVAASELACSRCEGTVLFVQLLQPDGSRKPDGLYCHPAPGGREPMTGQAHLRALSGPLARTYDSALKLYNHAEWGASALMLRHLIAGLTVQLLGDEQRDQSLPQRLDALARQLDLSRPLQDVAELMAPTGTFGRQFEDEAAIERMTVDLMLELAEQLIAYLVVMPGTMDDLKRRIATAPVPLRRGSGAA